MYVIKHDFFKIISTHEAHYCEYNSVVYMKTLKTSIQQVLKTAILGVYRQYNF